MSSASSDLTDLAGIASVPDRHSLLFRRPAGDCPGSASQGPDMSAPQYRGAGDPPARKNGAWGRAVPSDVATQVRLFQPPISQEGS